MVCGRVDGGTGFQYMKGMEFEWNFPKAELNFRKHGVSFEIAKEVFNDPLAIEWPDDCDFEERVNCGRAIPEQILLCCLHGTTAENQIDFSQKGYKK